MNIVKLQNELKNVPDQALIGYVQNPTGQVPSYLALSELQRRKEMREKYQAAQPEKTTVAEDLEQQAQPAGLAMLAKNPMPGAPTEQGVAGLPVPDQMFSGQGMAAGGIVAFADGGDTSMNLDRLPTLNVNTGQQSMGNLDGMLPGVNAMIEESKIPQFTMGKSTLPNPLYIVRGLTNTLTEFPQFISGSDAERKSMAERNFGPAVENMKLAQGGEVKSFADGGMLDSLRNYLLPPSPSTVRDLQGKTRMSPFMGGLGDTDAYQYADPNYLMKKRQMLYDQLNVPGVDKNAIYDQINAIDQQSKIGPAGGFVSQTKPALSDAEVQAKNTLAQTQTPPPPAAVANPYDIGAPKALTVEEAMKREQDAMKLAGVDPKFYETQSKELLAQREAIDKDKTQAGWMALARAGLGMAAGKSPFALQNIATGATEGLEQYGKESKELRAEQRLLKAADMKLAEAQNAQQRGDAQSAIKAIQDREKIIAEYNHYKMVSGATLEAAKIGAGARTGEGQLVGLYGALNKAQQAGNQALVDQIQARIDAIESSVGGGGALPAGVTVKKNK